MTSRWRLPPTRSTLLLCLLLLFNVSTRSYSIPFSTVFRRTQSLLKGASKEGTTQKTHVYSSWRHDRIPPFLRPNSTRSSVTITFSFLFGGFTEKKWTRRRRFLLSSAVKEDTTASPPPSSESAHLQLNSPAMLPKQQDDKHTKDSNSNKTGSSPTTSLLHTYTDPIHNISLSGLNVSKKKFCAWVNYTLHNQTWDESCITTRNIQVDSLETRQELRFLWKQQRLLTDRTEVLAVYQSEVEPFPKKNKRGGFSDLLHIYAERLSSIIEDEDEEHDISFKGKRTLNRTGVEETQVPLHVLNILKGGLLGWLQREYGKEETKQLWFENMKNLSMEKQYAIFKHFLEWFRLRFPYYYDRCDTCGASAKDEPEIVCIDDDGTNDDEEEHEDDDDNSSFLGYVHPSKEELLGKASRTEIYQCHKCGSFTRFPRYNAASSVIQHKRGRCGEYSMLLFRILRATGHTCRWIVDWADHVWAEVYLNGNWVHLDPCEAAVDMPLLYEGWGKQQTYIVAFHAPLANGGSLDETHVVNASFPLIEDVTLRYTSADLKEIQKRRDESDTELAEFVNKTIAELKQKLDRILNR